MIDLGRTVDLIVCFYLVYKAVQLIRIIISKTQESWMN